MAAGYLPAPNTEHGPCGTDGANCTWHDECEAIERMASAPCRWCEEPIGYVLGFYQDRWNVFEHAICAQRQVREERDHEEHDFADYARIVRERFSTV